MLDEYSDQLRNDLNEPSAMIITDDLLAWNTETDIAKRDSDDLAAEWLEAGDLSYGKAAGHAPGLPLVPHRRFVRTRRWGEVALLRLR